MTAEAELWFREMTRLKRGDFVRVRYRETDEWTQAFVGLASDSDPSSVMLLFDGAIHASGGLLMGALPLSVNYERQTAVSLLGDDYEIEVASREVEDDLLKV